MEVGGRGGRRWRGVDEHGGRWCEAGAQRLAKSASTSEYARRDLSRSCSNCFFSSLRVLINCFDLSFIAAIAACCCDTVCYGEHTHAVGSL